MGAAAFVPGQVPDATLAWETKIHLLAWETKIHPCYLSCGLLLFLGTLMRVSLLLTHICFSLWTKILIVAATCRNDCSPLISQLWGLNAPKQQ